MNNEKYYQILGIEMGSSQKEIKAAYRRLALQYHPDKNSDEDSLRIFLSIHNAYSILTNPDQDKEQKYSSSSYYDELIDELCESYGLSSDIRQEMYGIFDDQSFLQRTSKALDIVIRTQEQPNPYLLIGKSLIDILC